MVPKLPKIGTFLAERTVAHCRHDVDMRHQHDTYATVMLLCPLSLRTIPSLLVRPLTLTRTPSNAVLHRTPRLRTFTFTRGRTSAAGSASTRSVTRSTMATATTTGCEADLSNVSPPASDTRVSRDIAYPRQLYPEIEPYDTGMLDVGDGTSTHAHDKKMHSQKVRLNAAPLVVAVPAAVRGWLVYNELIPLPHRRCLCCNPCLHHPVGRPLFVLRAVRKQGWHPGT